jgi:hypothetical protein
LTIEKSLESITASDLQELVDNRVMERKSLDYKLLLPGTRDADKKEFLADVSSFANTNGGDLIYGIAQDHSTGYPSELTGIDLSNKDQEILRLESIIRDGLEPRVPPVGIHPVELANSKTVVIIRIGKSWLSPHRVKFAGEHRFYARGTNGRFELDVAELKNAFLFSESINEKIRKFKEGRISSLFANETPIPMDSTSKMVLHLIPLNSFNPSTAYDIDRLYCKWDYMRPFFGGSMDCRYNLEGILTYSIDSSGKSYSYTQIYRNGTIEIVDGLELGRQKVIPSVEYEKTIIESLPRYVSALKNISVELPIITFLTLIGVKGYSMAVVRFFEQESRTINQDILQLPEAIIENYEIKAERVLKPAFDAIWNACGFARSLNYDEQGEWKPERRNYFR